MPKRVRTGLTRTDILHRDIERFRQQLIKPRPFLSRKRAATSIDDFDESAEESISQVFGMPRMKPSRFLDQDGESASVPEEAQENGTHDIERESLHQRRQVLESCLADLQMRRLVQAAKQETAGPAGESRRLHVARRASIDRAATIREAGLLFKNTKSGR